MPPHSGLAGAHGSDEEDIPFTKHVSILYVLTRPNHAIRVYRALIAAYFAAEGRLHAHSGLRAHSRLRFPPKRENRQKGGFPVESSQIESSQFGSSQFGSS
jgi:hypothetical protein